MKTFLRLALLISFALMTLTAPMSSDQTAVTSAQSGEKGAPTQELQKGVAAFNQRFIGACRKMDEPGAAALWADNGADLLPGMDPMVGKPAISQWLNGLTAQMKGVKVLECDVDWQQIEVSGDFAYEWGINMQTVSVPNQPEPLKNKGKITLILRKQTDGSWKIALESWNSSPQAKAGSSSNPK